MIVDGKGNLFEDRRKKGERRKSNSEVSQERRKAERRKESNKINKK